jgi:glucuronoarabinoxylan endo-1,4-beta-xylanase
VSVDLLTAVAQNSPLEFRLEQNYPNPFNPSTTIHYALAQTSHVSLRVLDILGKEVATLVDRVEDAGAKSVLFDASKLASGAYIYRLQANDFIQTRKLTLAR